MKRPKSIIQPQSTILKFNNDSLNQFVSRLLDDISELRANNPGMNMPEIFLMMSKGRSGSIRILSETPSIELQLPGEVHARIRAHEKCTNCSSVSRVS